MRTIEITQKKRAKNLLEKSMRVLEEKHSNGQAKKFALKTKRSFTIIASNFVREQLITKQKTMIHSNKVDISVNPVGELRTS